MEIQHIQSFKVYRIAEMADKTQLPSQFGILIQFSRKQFQAWKGESWLCSHFSIASVAKLTSNWTIRRVLAIPCKSVSPLFTLSTCWDIGMHIWPLQQEGSIYPRGTQLLPNGRGEFGTANRWRLKPSQLLQIWHWDAQTSPGWKISEDLNSWITH